MQLIGVKKYWIDFKFKAVHNYFNLLVLIIELCLWLFNYIINWLFTLLLTHWKIKYYFPSANILVAHYLQCWFDHWQQHWKQNTSMLAQDWNSWIVSSINAFSAADSHGCPAGTSWYIQPASSSLLPPFWFHHHLCIYLYTLFYSSNNSQLSWWGDYYYSSKKKHSSCTPLFLRYQ